MAQHTKTRLAISAYAVLCFILTFAAVGVRNLVGWYGYLLLAIGALIWGGILFAKHRNPRFAWHRMPKALLLFLLLCTLSIAWSAYPLQSAVGAAAQIATSVAAAMIATVLTWHELLRTMATALRYVLGISVIFELAVDLFIRQPVLQNFIGVTTPTSQPASLYWSRALLFEGGPLQGIVANSTLLGFLALLGLILFAVQLRGKLVRPVKGWFWICFALTVLIFTHAATVWLALGVVLITTIFVKWTRLRGARKRGIVYLTGSALLLGGCVSVTLFWQQIVTFFNLNEHTKIWEHTAALGGTKPVWGWGWVSQWMPWTPPFDPATAQYMLPVPQAHNAWLDTYFQLGTIGTLVLALLILMTLQRLWCRAVDQPRRGAGPALPYATSAVYPLLIFVALLTQSLTESSILGVWGWLILVIFAVKTRIDYELPTKASEPVAVRWRDIPIARHSVE